MKFRFLIFFVVCFQLINAQTITTSVSTTIPKLADNLYAGLKKIGNNYFAYEFDLKSNVELYRNASNLKYSFKLKKLDANFNVVTENDPSNTEKIYGPFQPQYQVMGDKLFFFYFQTGEDGTTIKTFVSQVNMSTMALGTPTELMDIQPQHSNEFLFGDILMIKPSPDSSKNLVLWQSRNGIVFFYAVTNSDFKLIRTEKAEIPDAEDMPQIHNMAVTNSGAVYIPYAYTKKSDHYGYVYNNTADNTTKLIEIKDPEIQVASVFISPVSGNDYAITGTYLTGKGSDNLSGVFYQPINTTSNELGAIKKTAFPDPLVSELENLKWANSKKSKFGITPIDLNIYAFDDGTVSLSGQFKEKTYTVSGVEHTRYGSIFNVYLKNNEATFSIIPKNVALTTRAEAGFFPIAYKNKLLVFYNDDPSNPDKSISDKPVNFDYGKKGNVVVSASFERDGSVKRSVLIEPEEKNIGMIDEAKNTSGNGFVLPIGKLGSLGPGWNTVNNWTTIKIK